MEHGEFMGQEKQTTGDSKSYSFDQTENYMLRSFESVKLVLQSVTEKSMTWCLGLGSLS